MSHTLPCQSTEINRKTDFGKKAPPGLQNPKRHSRSVRACRPAWGIVGDSRPIAFVHQPQHILVSICTAVQWQCREAHCCLNVHYIYATRYIADSSRRKVSRPGAPAWRYSSMYARAYAGASRRALMVTREFSRPEKAEQLFPTKSFVQLCKGLALWSNSLSEQLRLTNETSGRKKK